MKLWVFGDSFAEMYENSIKEYAWQIQISKALKCDVINIAHNGASSEWLILQLSKYWNEITSNDIVIVLIPYWDRQCIFPEDPDFSHLYAVQNYGTDPHITKRWNKYGKEAKISFEQYFMNLYNEDLVKITTQSLYAWIGHLTTVLDIPPLVLETRNQIVDNYFKNSCSIVHGNLFDISMHEWEDQKDWIKLTKKALYKDFRLSHLSEQNHNVLANKIVNHFKHNNQIDLTTGFYKSILSKGIVDTTMQQ